MKFIVALLVCVVAVSAAPPALELVDNAEVFDQSPAEQFECIANYLGEISKANGLNDIWARSEPILKRHIDDWKGCSKSTKKVWKILCNLKNGFQTFRTFADYVKVMGAQNPKLLIEFVRGLPQHCNGQAVAEHFEELFDL